jgi:hypothetical protein
MWYIMIPVWVLGGLGVWVCFAAVSLKIEEARTKAQEK